MNDDRRPSLVLEGVSKAYGSFRALDAIDLAARDGEFLAVVGPSGCGKSTLLKLVAGLEPVDRGRIAIGGRDVTAAEPHVRGIAMVFQSYALYPHMTVAENMGFGLRLARRPRAEIAAGVARAAEILQLTPLLGRYPRELSGGQRQRVAVGRAIVRSPQVFLFDEPLSNLDAKLRHQLRGELGQLHARLGATMLYVTHDQIEAMTMADRIAVLNGGRLEQVGRPMDLYLNPATRFVGGFIGSLGMTFLPVTAGRIEPGRITVSAPGLGPLALPLATDAQAVPGQALCLGVRPEDLVPAPPGAAAVLRGRLERVERVGRDTTLYLRTQGLAAETSDREPALLTAHVSAPLAVSAEQDLALALPLDALRLFDAGSGRSLSPPRADDLRLTGTDGRARSGLRAHRPDVGEGLGQR